MTMISGSSIETTISAGGVRQGYLDALKCLAILFVVVGHVDGMKIGINAYDTLWGCIRYTFQMPLFFFISGMFACHGIDRGTPLHLLIWNKIKTLLWPALVFDTIMSLSIGITPGLLLFARNGFYWFTITLFECFLIYYVIVYPLKAKRTISNILLAVVSAVFIVLLALKIDSPKLAFLDLNHLTKYFQYFFLGTLFTMYHKIGDRILKSQTLYALSIVGFGVLMLLVYKNMLPDAVSSISRHLILRYLGLYIVFALFYNVRDIFNQANKTMSLARYIGRHSLEIYLLHFFFLPTLMWLKPFRVDNMFAIELPISLGIAALVVSEVLVLNYILTRSKYISKLLYGK